MKKILLIEDNKEINDSIKKYLELDNFFVKSCFDWTDWIEYALTWKYDLILLDIMLPEIDGIRLAEKVVSKIKTPIIMITARDSIDDKLLWFDSWAVDYIVKPFDLRELEARIFSVLGRNNEDLTFTFEDISIDLKSRNFVKSWDSVKVTQKEFLILELLLKHKWEVVSRTDIIYYVWWESSLFDADSKLDVYISNLRNKFSKSIIETIKWFWYKIN